MEELTKHLGLGDNVTFVGNLASRENPLIGDDSSLAPAWFMTVYWVTLCMLREVPGWLARFVLQMLVLSSSAVLLSKTKCSVNTVHWAQAVHFWTTLLSDHSVAVGSPAKVIKQKQ